MKNIKLLSTALPFLVIASTVHAAVIVNGSFEDPIVTAGEFQSFNDGSTAIAGWTVIQGSSLVSGTRTEGVITWNAQIGDAWIDLTGEIQNTDFGITQTIVTDIGQHYQLSFYVGSATDNFWYSASTVDLKIDSGPRVAYHNPNSPTTYLDWQQFTVNFTATNATTSISFFNGSTSYNNLSALDNVSIAAIPEPSIAGLAILSLCATPLIRKRQPSMRS